MLETAQMDVLISYVPTDFEDDEKRKWYTWKSKNFEELTKGVKRESRAF